MNPETPQVPTPAPVSESPADPVVSAQPIAPIPAQPVMPAKKSKKGLIIGIVVLLLVVIGVIGVSTALKVTSGPAAVSDAYVTDLKAGNFSAAETLESPTMKQSATADQVAAAWKDTGFPNTTFKAVDKLVQTQSGKEYSDIVYKFDGVNNSVFLHVRLVNNSGTWQVLNFKTTDSSTGIIE